MSYTAPSPDEVFRRLTVVTMATYYVMSPREGDGPGMSYRPSEPGVTQIIGEARDALELMWAKYSGAKTGTNARGVHITPAMSAVHDARNELFGAKRGDDPDPFRLAICYFRAAVKAAEEQMADERVSV